MPTPQAESRPVADLPCRGAWRTGAGPAVRARATVLSGSILATIVSLLLLETFSPVPNHSVFLLGLTIVLVLLAYGDDGIRSSNSLLSRPLVFAVVLIAAVWFILVGAVPSLAYAIVEPSRPLIIGLIILASTVGVMRYAILSLAKPQVAWVTTVDSQSDTYRPRGAVQVIRLAENLCDNPKAVASAIVPLVSGNDISTVVLDETFGAEVATELSWQLRRCRIHLELKVNATAISAKRIRMLSQPGRSSLVILPPEPSSSTRLLKRIFDVTVASILIVCLGPLMVFIAIAIKLRMPGPVFYTQERIGRDGIAFKMIKFRTMIVNADAALASLLAEQQGGDAPLFKIADDPRITKLGRTLRRFSLDELPQLFNVLNGSMSLVGPRPQRAEEVALYTGTADHRLGVLPGMTGLWQVSGRSNLSWEQAQELDVYYAHNWSLGFDLVILARTFKAVVRATGAV